MYAPNSKYKKNDYWEEIAAARVVCGGPWVTSEDFNNKRRMVERRGCNRTTTRMTGFPRWIEEMELHDHHLNGGRFTWVRGLNMYSVSRLDRFLYSMS